MLRQLANRLPQYSANLRRTTSSSLITRSSYSTDASTSTAPVYVVFGAYGGIGSELCARLAQQPGAVVVAAGRDAAKLEALRGRIGCAGTGMVADVLNPQQVEEVISRTTEMYGKVDGVANCVGSIVLKSAHATSDEEFNRTVQLNLNSCFYILKSAVKKMMGSGGGSVVFCSSAVARHGIPNHEAIAAAKAGVVGLMLSAAATYAPKNIRVNCVAPGLTRTPLAARITSNPAALKSSEAMHALKRVGEAGEVAAALEFLLRPDNTFITGQVLGVDGGLGSLKPQ
ncbi:hypothetical protein VOLCADRAFT_108315 [Volvox carteri f. nagariensis]|uniref:Ketoreductase domain-containing protein n=1 Tax=Volvox carteri f. nagariensis TaxID=3068 RepID=D8UJE7_VOLCA|nr:uncharacterized protein VOLCADRAFT_108315 [Volvox carteri f. nagariensis]EFJ40176.1 hypothetical protein VOLCADRAFT_108315 [Volvox carteri f. nagariensis]|eukprot:XP_002958786.1 hypothetical protein VOLCADRAFT_108315 [Volvox carteri f. nagariensis]